MDILLVKHYAKFIMINCLCSCRMAENEEICAPLGTQNTSGTQVPSAPTPPTSTSGTHQT